MANFEPIEAEIRARAGKGVARATRRAGKVPAVIYGAKQEPTLIALDPRIIMRELKRGGWRSRLYEVQHGADKSRALMRDVHFHAVTDQPEHVDFQRLAPGEAIRVAVQVVFTNEGISPGIKRGGVLNVVRHAVEVLCDPDHIPERFEADLGTLNINDNIRWSDLKGTGETKPTIADRDFVVATVGAPTVITETAEDATAGSPTPTAAPAKGGAAKAAAPAKGAAPAAKAPAAKAPAAKKK